MPMLLSEIAQRIEADAHIVTDGFVSELLTDSRSLFEPGGVLFFALHTAAGDGRFYIPELYEKGVRDFVVEQPYGAEVVLSLPEANILIVPDTLAALRRLGASVRADYRGTVVAIAGSRGKTPLKEMLRQLLVDQHPVASPRSYNSQIGVPLSLWQLAGSTAPVALIEAGVSRSGEMAELHHMIRPDVVVYTSLTEEHAEGFSSIEEKAAQKALLAHGARSVIVGANQSLMITALEAVAPGALTTVNPGSSPAEALARAVAARIGMEEDAVNQRLTNLIPVDTRISVVEGFNNCRLILDAFTPDLLSLRSAIDFMRRRMTPGMEATVILTDPLDDDLSALPALMRAGAVTRFIGIGPRLMAVARELMAGVMEADHICLFADQAHAATALSPADFSSELILLKAPPTADVMRLADRLQAQRHESVLEVNLKAIATNYNLYKSCLPAGCRLTAMVKAEAYGMGAYEVARTLQDQGAAYLAVAVLDEGVELRRKGITMPIMVMNPKTHNYRSMFAQRLEPEIYSLPMLRDVIDQARRYGLTAYPVHLKLDTGMHRMGLVERELDEAVRLITAQNAVRVASIFSHLATADCPDMDTYTLEQIHLFERLTAQLVERLPAPRPLLHILNSAGIARFPQYGMDMARLGIGLYGVDTINGLAPVGLRPVAELHTTIVALRSYDAGQTVGYGRRGVLTRPSTIATIPIGYADGFNRRYGNGAIEVYVRGHRVPTIGNICMDACMLNVTNVPDISVGDDVEIFGRHLPLQRLSDTLGTIPYEVLTAVSGRVRRLYFRD